MNLLIRSQSGKGLINVECVDGIGLNDIFDDFRLIVSSKGENYLIGQYSTLEKATKVLDMIEEAYLDEAFCYTFHMPADDEVEV